MASLRAKMQNRPTLEQFGPIAARLPSDWPERGAKLPRRERVAVTPSLDELAAVAVMEPVRKAPPKEEEFEEVEEVRAEVPAGISDEDADSAVGVAFADLPVVEAPKNAVVEITGADKIESVLNTLPDDIVRFIEDEMRARFVGVKVV